MLSSLTLPRGGCLLSGGDFDGGAKFFYGNEKNNKQYSGSDAPDAGTDGVPSG